jgi:hypothetical protein
MPSRHTQHGPRAAGRPYSVLLPVGFTLPAPLPERRCALTAPFHPCPWKGLRPCTGGLLSVALSLGSPPPAVSRHRIPVEPGLSSATPGGVTAAVQPSGGGLIAPCPPCGQPAVYTDAVCTDLASTKARSAVSLSASPSTRSGRQWRWKARSTVAKAASPCSAPGTL